MDMKKRKLQAIGPICPSRDDMIKIDRDLGFLKESYEMEFLDPLMDIPLNVNVNSFYKTWTKKLKNSHVNYQGFLGFSLGGVILQKCIGMLRERDMPVVLFSTPSFVNNSLKDQLGNIMKKLENHEVESAVRELNKRVYYPNNPPKLNISKYNKNEVNHRLQEGFKLILNDQMKDSVNEEEVEYLHLVGEESVLVNSENVLQTGKGKVEYVPCAGMRVLRDNKDYCRKIIMEYLSNYE